MERRNIFGTFYILHLFFQFSSNSKCHKTASKYVHINLYVKGKKLLTKDLVKFVQLGSWMRIGIRQKEITHIG